MRAAMHWFLVRLLIYALCAIAAMLLFIGFAFVKAHAREGDNHGNHGDLKPWFDQLASKRGLCCSFADGLALKDIDWDTKDGHFRVRIAAGSVEGYAGKKEPQQDEWIVVPDDSVITEPNRFGQAVVWPFVNGDEIAIRCFMPGAGT
jgi:hypothetical protein